MNQTDIMTLKQRNGPVGNSTVQFHPKTASFVNVAFGGDDGRGWGE
jgi:replicative DNA helicase